MRRWTRPLPAEPDRGILSHVWTTSTCYKPLEIERNVYMPCMRYTRILSRPPLTSIVCFSGLHVLINALLSKTTSPCSLSPSIEYTELAVAAERERTPVEAA